MESDSTIQLAHLPQHPVHISLFKDVRNSAFLRQQLLAGNAEFEYGFVDATTVKEIYPCGNIAADEFVLG
jgi:EKC/KEOPS complex subunit CGI121/TPRKB